MIETRSIRVDYKDVVAVRALTLTIGPGEIFGLIGPNGAGKSSTIRVLATLQEPTHGEVRIAGIDIADDVHAARHVIGYMPDLAPVCDDLRCWEFLDLFAAAYGLPRAERRRRVEDCLDQVDLTSKRTAKAGTLSRGMKQRLMLAKTVLTEPKVLLLDEPASGLDPIARMELRNLLRRQAEQDRTVLVSSHILTELAEFCTSVGIMQKGELLASGPPDTIAASFQTGRTLMLRLVEPHVQAESMFIAACTPGSVVRAADGMSGAFGGDDRAAAELVRAVVGTGALVRSFGVEDSDLEDIMVRMGAREVS
jgi:ABC-2 type transport system ATP-binding protein